MQADAPARQAAADALGEIGRWGANELLLAAARDDEQPEQALAALLALAHGGDPAVLQAALVDTGRTPRLLHRELPRTAVALRPRILALLERLGQPLLHVPAGDFSMGSVGDLADERPQHRVTLAEYWIDRYPVTNAQFAAFVKAMGYQAQGKFVLPVTH